MKGFAGTNALKRCERTAVEGSDGEPGAEGHPQDLRGEVQSAGVDRESGLSRIVELNRVA